MVRVAAPLGVSDDAVRLAVIGKLGWIRRQQARFDSQPRQSQRVMAGGESHYYLGRRYRLDVIEHRGAGSVRLRNRSIMELYVRPESTPLQRERVLLQWYREQLRRMIPPLLERWEAAMDVSASGWGIRRMKTRWGTCNIETRRIWLNLELIKKPPQCLEYVVVHELAHLIERHHNDRFIAIMDRHLPQWREHRAVLSSAPLGHERWMY